MHSHDTPVFPWRHIPLEYAGGSRMAGALELAAPLALGQRGMIIAPPRTGASTVLRWMTAAFLAAVPGATAVAALIDRPAEDALDWQYEVPDASVIGTTSEHPLEQHAATFDQLVALIDEREAEQHLLIAIDSLSAIAKARTAITASEDQRVLDGGISQESLIELRQLFGRARCGEREADGSLTIIGTMPTGTSQQLDEVVQHELVGTGNVEWHLDEPSFRSGMFPPVDILTSGARHTEIIVGEAAADARANLRSHVVDQGTSAGLAILLEKLDMDGPLSRILDDL